MAHGIYVFLSFFFFKEETRHKLQTLEGFNFSGERSYHRDVSKSLNFPWKNEQRKLQLDVQRAELGLFLSLSHPGEDQNADLAQQTAGPQ